MLRRLIKSNQGAFLEGRWIADNTIITHEVVHKIKKHKSKNGLMAVKLDLSKAYDKVAWKFLINILKNLGFSENMCELISHWIFTVRYFILLNEDVVGNIFPKRGIHQGDPLSPFLFLLCAETLSRLLARKEAIGKVHRIKIAWQVRPISHLLYVDDLLFFCRENSAKTNVLAKSFNCYCRWSGQLANKDKSHVWFSKETSQEVKEEIRTILEFKELKKGIIYLGNSLLISRQKVKEFNKLKERVQRRLEGWQNKLLPTTGKATLIKSMVQAIPEYSMSTFQIPTSICNQLDTLACRFWWGKKPNQPHLLALKAWRSLCVPKQCGGLGFKQFKVINLALFSKLSWKVASQEKSLWVELVSAKYLKGESFFSYKLKKGVSFIWRGIVWAREAFTKVGCFSIRDGRDINLWTDP